MDWSSVVCSSDLQPELRYPRAPDRRELAVTDEAGEGDQPGQQAGDLDEVRGHHRRAQQGIAAERGNTAVTAQQAVGIHHQVEAEQQRAQPRSEEPTSELQSLMRISYAVFSFNKTK